MSLEQLDLKEKIALCSGEDTWHTKSFSTADIPSLCMSDGPHGLRKMSDGSDLTDIDNSLPSTCFPSAALTACSWDEELIEEMGRALGEDAASLGVGLLLGPGANIKRNPLCGRNFEYFSEDPLLSGKMAAALIRGVQSRGVGACLKHFACNNQEYKRFQSDSVLDDRTLRELYLSAFEIAVRESRPAAVMCAYNKINGTHCSDNQRLLTDILRGEWGFDGMVVTDWGALNDRVSAFKAGCDLNMPGGSSYQEKMAMLAIKDGRLDKQFVERSAERIAALSRRVQKAQTERRDFDHDAHHALARRIAVESAVLLKNKDHILPLRKNIDVLLIGPMVKQLRYQGGGSSHINPLQLRQLSEVRADLPYVPGCLPDGSSDKKLLKQAEKAAKKAGVPVILAGLPDSYESEGFDRSDMAMPDGYNELIETVAAVNPHTVVVLMAGSPVELPWADKVKSILYMGLPGEAGAEAIADLLFGEVSPSGKLAETWPVSYLDCVSSSYYSGQNKDAHYREGVYVGYRYYQKAGVRVRYPFGYGLSYSEFVYSDLRISGNHVCFSVKNKGKCDASEIVQLYVSPPEGTGYRPALECRAFRKIRLRKGETVSVNFELTNRSFALWQNGWIVPPGTYGVHIGSSSEDLRLHGTIHKEGDPWKEPALPDWYISPSGTPSHIDFEHLLGRPVTVRSQSKGCYTMDSTFDEMKEDSAVAGLIYRVMAKKLLKSTGNDKNSAKYRMALSTVSDAPLRTLQMFLGKESSTMEYLLDWINGHPGKVLEGLIKKSRTE